MKNIPIIEPLTTEIIQARIQDISQRTAEATRTYQQNRSIQIYQQTLKQLERELDQLLSGHTQIFSKTNERCLTAAVSAIQAFQNRLTNTQK
jgi:hypothetical protein